MRYFLKLFIIILSKIIFVLLATLSIYVFFGTILGFINNYTSSSTTSDGQTSFSSGIYREGMTYTYILLGLFIIAIGYIVYTKQAKSYCKWLFGFWGSLVVLILSYIAIAILIHDPIVPRPLTVHQLLTGYNIVYTHDGKLYQNDEYVMDLENILVDVDLDRVKNCNNREECSLGVLSHVTNNDISSYTLGGIVDKNGYLMLYENINFTPYSGWGRGFSVSYMVDIKNKTGFVISSGVNSNGGIISYEIFGDKSITYQRTGDTSVYDTLYIDGKEIGPYSIIIKQNNGLLLQEREKWVNVPSAGMPPIKNNNHINFEKDGINNFLWYDFADREKNMNISYMGLRDGLIAKHIGGNIDTSLYILKIIGIINGLPIIELSTTEEKLLFKGDDLLWTGNRERIEIHDSNIYTRKYNEGSMDGIIYINNVLLKDDIIGGGGGLIQTDTCFGRSILCKIGERYYDFNKDIIKKIRWYSDYYTENLFFTILHFVYNTDSIYINKYGVTSKDYTLANYHSQSLKGLKQKTIYRNKIIQKTIGYHGWNFLRKSLPKIITLDDRLIDLQLAIENMQKDLFKIDKVILIGFDAGGELGSETKVLIEGVDNFLGIYPTTPPENNDPNANINIGQLIMDTYFPEEEAEIEVESGANENEVFLELLKQREARLNRETSQ